jgi:hypothetical protein
MMIRIGFQRSAHHFVRSILRSDQQQQTFPSLFSWHRPQTYRETPQFRFRQPFATRRNICSQKEGDDWITASTAVSAQVHDSYDVAWNNRYKGDYRSYLSSVHHAFAFAHIGMVLFS